MPHLTPPNSGVVDLLRSERPLLWAQLAEPANPIYFADAVPLPDVRRSSRQTPVAWASRGNREVERPARHSA